MTHSIEVRRMGPGDESLVVAARYLFQRGIDETALSGYLRSSTDYLVIAYLDGVPVGYARAHVLRRLDGPRPKLFLYEIETAAGFRRRGVAKALVDDLKRIGRDVDARLMFVLTNRSNEAATALYTSTGGVAGPDDEVSYVYELD